jgi:Sec-independent protein secretion pathway component TatC
MHVHIHVAVPLADMNIYVFVSKGLSNIKRQIWTTIVAHNTYLMIIGQSHFYEIWITLDVTKTKN